MLPADSTRPGTQSDFVAEGDNADGARIFLYRTEAERAATR